MSKPKLKFFVGNFVGRNSGYGGHYRSISTIADSLSLQYDCTVVCVGDAMAAGVNPSVASTDFVKCNWYNWTARRVDFQPVVEGKSVVVFGVGASICNPLLQICRENGMPLIGIKAGGPRRRGWKMASRAQIFFSKSDYDLAAISKGVDAHWIPNRIVPFSRDPLWASRFSRVIESTDSLVVGHVARFSPDKEKAHIATVEFANLLRSSGVAASCVLLGAVDSTVTFQNVKAALGPCDVALTDSSLTKDARQLCYNVDIMVGMGRSFMESAMTGVPTLAVAGDCFLPIKVTKDRFQVFLKENFSNRTSLNIGTNEIEDELIDFSSNGVDRMENAKQVQVWTEQHFSASAGIEKYVKAIKSAEGSSVVGCGGLMENFYLHMSPSKALLGIASDFITGKWTRLNSILN